MIQCLALLKGITHRNEYGLTETPPKPPAPPQPTLPGWAECGGSSVRMGSPEMLRWSTGWGATHGMPTNQIIPF